MSFIYSNYDRLRDENNGELAKISTQNKKILINMFHYLASRRLSVFELELIKKDLIGLAQEADIEHISVHDKISISEEDFCDSLISDTSKIALSSILLPIIRNCSLILCGIYSIYFIGSGFTSSRGISVDMLLLSLILCAVDLNFGFASSFLWGRTTYSHSYRTRTLILLLSIILISAIRIPFKIRAEIYIISGNGWSILAVLILLAFALWVVTNYYFDSCLEKYNWE